MAGTSKDLELELVTSTRVLTGKSLVTWLLILARQPFRRRSKIVEFLTSTYHLEFLHASLIAGIFLNNGQSVYL